MNRNSQILVSLHVPKTGGTSLLRVLQAQFGERLLKDYQDRPLSTARMPRLLRAFTGFARNYLSKPPEYVACIHGHFMPLKYLGLSRWAHLNFVMWLRDPVERAASHYYYWLRSYKEGISSPLHHRMVQERWSLERFCLGPELRNVYSQLLWGFPLSRFSFIGITDDFDRSYREFCDRFLDGKVPMQRLRVNPDASRDSYIRDPGLRKSIEKYHSTDMKLYRELLALRGIQE